MLKIDKHLSYRQGLYTYKNFVDLSQDELEMVLQWRNDSSIRQYMYNRNIISLSDHLAYVHSLNERNDRLYWLVYRAEEPVGVVDLTDIEIAKARAELGYYMSPQKKNSGMGLDFVFNLLIFIFERGFMELYGNVDKNNKNALILDEYLGCEFMYDKEYEENGATYIPWALNKSVFEKDCEQKNNIRAYYIYIKQHYVN